MKHLNIPLEDKEHALLEQKKGNKTWHDFIMELVTQEKGGEQR